MREVEHRAVDRSAQSPDRRLHPGRWDGHLGGERPLATPGAPDDADGLPDPYGLLDPRMRVIDIVTEPLAIQGTLDGQQRRERGEELLTMVGLRSGDVARYPHEFSGGQRQRIAIARALALNPRVVIAGEPVSALDVSIQAQVINLLRSLQAELGLAYLFIAHDLAVVRTISHSVAVMYLGRVVESAPTAELFSKPVHPYTVALLSAVPLPNPASRRRRRRIVLAGDVPSPANPPSGCRFHTRCWLREELGRPERCEREDPALAQTTVGHRVACHFADRVIGSQVQQDVVGAVGWAGSATPAPSTAATALSLTLWWSRPSRTIAPVELGLVLPHEHIFLRAWEIAGRYDLAGQFEDDDVLADELAAFRDAGGGAIVDLTVRGLGRRPERVREISQRVGLPIVMGCGWYREPYSRPRTRSTDRAPANSRRSCSARSRRARRGQASGRASSARSESTSHGSQRWRSGSTGPRREPTRIRARDHAARGAE